MLFRSLNENLGRELLELHTLGVDGGYTQDDVRTAARVLTGLGYATAEQPPRQPPAAYRRLGLTEFLPSRHDSGPKVLLGQPLRAEGLAEVDEMLDRLARHPSTARHVCRRLAHYFLGQPPGEALLQRLSAVFLAQDGRTDAVMRALFDDPAFEASLGQGFKDPTHWLVSALRLGLDGPDLGVPDAGQLVGWLTRLGQPPYGRLTPDGYPLEDSAWSGPGQLTARFDVARTLAATWPRLWTGGRAPGLDEALAQALRTPGIAAATREVLAQARTPADRLALWLSSPEFMRR